MRLNKNETIGGVPVLRVRKLVRSRNGNDDLYYSRNVDYGYYDGIADPQALLAAMIDAGLVDRLPDDADGDEVYRVTTRGLAFSQATAGPGFKRETAQRAVDEFLERVQELNQRSDLLYGVSRVGVFGSFSGKTEMVNDVDLCVEFFRRHSAVDWITRSKERANVARAEGKRFISFMEELYWPYREVVLFLKQRSRIINLHDYGDAAAIGAVVKPLYESGIELEPSKGETYERVEIAPRAKVGTLDNGTA